MAFQLGNKCAQGKIPWNKGKKGVMVAWNKGKKMSQQHKDNVRKANLGKKYSEETKQKHRELFMGSKNPRWKGGITNYERKLYLVARRRALNKGAIGSFSQGEWELLKIQYNFTCPRCFKKEPEIKLTIDHIIPLSKGGSNWIENIQPLCRSCNSWKYIKIIKFVV